MDAGLPDIGHIDRWQLGIPAGALGSGDGGIAFTAAELAGGQPGGPPRIGLHIAMTAERPAPPSGVPRPSVLQSSPHSAHSPLAPLPSHPTHRPALQPPFRARSTR